MAAIPRFAFVVHPLSRLHRVIIGVRRLSPGLMAGNPHVGMGPICHLRLGDQVDGVVVATGLTPEQMLGDQHLALEAMARAVAAAGPVDAVGLGALCAVVAGRGEALQEKVGMPVTTGAAATAWALAENAARVAERVGGPVAILGAKSAVGGAVVSRLQRRGFDVRTDLGKTSPAEIVAGMPVVVGAATTGPLVDAKDLAPNAIVVDVAIPGILKGHRADLRVLAGEAVSLPAAWDKGFWGRLYHLFAGYGPSQVFACLVEPLVLAVSARKEPFALGRRVEDAAVEAFAATATELGFVPRLASGWNAIEGDALPQRMLAD